MLNHGCLDHGGHELRSELWFYFKFIHNPKFMINRGAGSGHLCKGNFLQNRTRNVPHKIRSRQNKSSGSKCCGHLI